jgi:hypothetical protein
MTHSQPAQAAEHTSQALAHVLTRLLGGPLQIISIASKKGTFGKKRLQHCVRFVSATWQLHSACSRGYNEGHRDQQVSTAYL